MALNNFQPLFKRHFTSETTLFSLLNRPGFKVILSFEAFDTGGPTPAKDLNCNTAL